MTGRPEIITRVALVSVVAAAGVGAWLTLGTTESAGKTARRHVETRVVPRARGLAEDDVPELAHIDSIDVATRDSVDPEPQASGAGTTESAPIVETAASSEPPARPTAPAASRLERTERRGAVGLPELRADRGAASGVDWLVRHQGDDGSWDADGFGTDDDFRWPESARGELDADVRVTSLALLALLEDGHTLLQGEHTTPVKRAAVWLIDRQDEETGQLGERVGLAGTVDHAFATFALGELFAADRIVLTGVKHRRALTHLEDAARSHAAEVAALSGIGEDLAREMWLLHVGRMRAYVDVETRRAMRLEPRSTCGTLEWRWAIHTHIAGNSDAQDVFANYTVESLRRSSDARIAAWSRELHDLQLQEGDARGAFLSPDQRHRSIGAVGTTALSVIALVNVADRLDETHDGMRWGH